jgi:hypothetical protein
VRAKLPLQKSSFSPATAPEKSLLWWCVIVEITVQLGTPRGRFDEYSSEFSLSKKPKFNFIHKKAKLQKVMPASFATALDNLYGTSSKLCFASGNMEPAHNTTKYFALNLR